MTPFQLTLSDQALIKGEVSGQGIAVFFISGLGGTASFWKGVNLNQRIFKTIRFDQRGIASSGRGTAEVTIDRLAQDGLEVLDHLGIKQAHLVGHSTGGCIAQTMALKQPDRVSSLILSGTWAGPNDYMQYLFSLRSTLLKQSEDAYVRQGVYLSYPPSYIWKNTGLLPSSTVLWTSQYKKVVQERIDALLAFDARAALSNLDMRALVMGAKDDAVVPYYLQQELYQLIPDASFQELEVGGHFFPTTKQAYYRSTLIDWILLNFK